MGTQRRQVGNLHCFDQALFDNISPCEGIFGFAHVHGIYSIATHTGGSQVNSVLYSVLYKMDVSFLIMRSKFLLAV